MKTIRGTIARIAVHCLDKGGFYVIELEGDPPRTCVGTAEFLAVDSDVILYGEWVNRSGWGKQFRVTELRYADSENALQALLSSGFVTGLGQHKAKLLVEMYGSQTIDLMNQGIDGTLEEKAEAERKLCKVRGLGPMVVGWILESWEAQRNWAMSALECVRVGFSLKVAKRLHKQFGETLPKVIRQSPYLLTTVRGITWAKADQIAKLSWPGKEPIGHDSQQRYSAAVREVLRQQLNNGHTCYGEQVTLKEAIELAKPGNVSLFRTKVRQCYTEKERIVLYGHYLYLLDVYNIEVNSAKRLAELMQAGPHKMAPKWDDFEKLIPQMIDFVLSSDQIKAIQMAFENPVLVITGGPGTGKTTIVQLIVQAFKLAGMSIGLSAPTGKAAIRLGEVTDEDAATIHRTLGIDGDGSRRYGFGVNLVVVDEYSMVDARLHGHVVDAHRKGAHIVFVGDVDQLPSVGPGDILYEIIKCGVPTARLDTIHRVGKESGIAHAAALIRQGIVPPDSFNETYDDFRIIRLANNSALARRVPEIINGICKKYGITHKEVQVLTTVNKSAWGQIQLNLKCQEIYNPGPFPLAAVHLKQDDPVIHTKNNYHMPQGKEVMNGQTGRVTWMSDTETENAHKKDVSQTVAWDDEEQTDESEFIVKVQYGDDQVFYTRDNVHEIQPSYAITVHKSQGSEYQYVVVLVPNVHFAQYMTRQLVYTGATRARKYCMIVSAGDAVDRHILNAERVRRFTCFSEHFQKALNVIRAA